MNQPKFSDFDTFIRELRELQHCLRLLGDSIHREDGLTFPERAMLTYLEINGPRTISEIARSRLVSRQHIQVTARRLEKTGWIWCRENPNHRRSYFLELTASGRSRIKSMKKREQAAFAKLEIPLPLNEFKKLNVTLVHLRKTILEFTALTAAETASVPPKTSLNPPRFKSISL
jgi:DNA-binding MarR family transcriptional regulator